MEADDVRRAACFEPTAIVILTASEALPGLVSTLARTPHIRVVHDFYYWRSPLLRALDRITRQGLTRLEIVCQREGMRGLLAEYAPSARICVRTFALARPAESAAASPTDRRGTGPSRLTVAVIGAWTHWKDTHTMMDGINRCLEATTDVHFVVAGSHLPGSSSLSPGVRNGRITLIERTLEPHELERIYHASDAILVCRKPGMQKESGAVMDAARYGLHLITSDHDDHLTPTLRRQDWATVFSRGQPESLAHAIMDLSKANIVRPGQDAQSVLGMCSADAALDFYTGLSQTSSLVSYESRFHQTTADI